MIKLNKPKTLPWQYEALTVKGQSLFLIKVCGCIFAYTNDRKEQSNGSIMVCAWICCDNNSCTCNGKTYHQKLKSEVKMFGLIMTLTAKVAVEMFAKGAGTAITLLYTGTKLRKRK